MTRPAAVTFTVTVRLLRGIGRAVQAVWAELWWWLSRGARLWWRYSVRASAFLLTVLALAAFDQQLLALTLAVPVIGVGVWARLEPVSYWMRLAGPLADWRLKRAVRHDWPALMESVGLARRIPAVLRPSRRHGEAAVPVAELVESPRLGRLRWVGGELVAWPRLLTGQTVDDVQLVADRLRVAVDALRCRIVPNSTSTACTVVWSFHDPLNRPFTATVPAIDAPSGDLSSVVLGRTEDGDLRRLQLGLSTLTAGCSGSGKASLIWGLILALGPENRAGLVQLHGIDLKGGMELSMGADLFTRYAQTADTAVALLEDAATALQARAQRLAGHTRQHAPTVDEPLVVVVVDELAVLVAYTSDRELTRRAEAALSVILSQGRAVGFLAFAFLQDPRKETVKMRHLFTQAIGLRLRDREEVAMVLGDGAIHAGALCHKIPASTPGVGYVLGEDNRPIRVRAGYVTDEMIRTAAHRFPAPVRVPIVAAEPVEPRLRSSRSTRPRATAGESS